MKVVVKRDLTGGWYRISFTITDFSEDERDRFTRFGVPTAKLTLGQQTVNMQQLDMPVTGIRPEHAAVFSTAEAARNYEQSVLREIQVKMAALKQLTDDFSGADEVVL
jgi:hypothetical protein